MTRALLIPLLALALLWSPARAETPPVRGDVRLLVDVTASLEQTDPADLRLPALLLLVDLLPDGALAGIWTFGDGVVELVPHGPVDAAWREGARAALQGLGSGDILTDIPAALAAATAVEADPALNPGVILFTDGELDVAGSPMVDAAAARELVEGMAQDLAARGIPVHSVALSQQADVAFLAELAAVTGGTVSQAARPGQLAELLVQALEQVARPQSLPLRDHAFVVDPSVSQITVVATAPSDLESIYLQRPDGERLALSSGGNAVRWSVSPKLVAARVDKPATGQWRWHAPSEGRARVVAATDLRLDVSPSTLRLQTGEALSVGLRVLSAGVAINDPARLSGFRFSSHARGPNGYRGNPELVPEGEMAPDGLQRFAIAGFEQPGRYRLLLRMAADDLQREVALLLDVVPVAGVGALVTRGNAPLEEDLTSLLLAALLAAAGLWVVVWLVLRRRQQRKLALWQKRATSAAQRTGEFRRPPGVGDHLD